MLRAPLTIAAAPLEDSKVSEAEPLGTFRHARPGRLRFPWGHSSIALARGGRARSPTPQLDILR